VESHVALVVFATAAYLLAFIIAALVVYWIVRLAVTHALRSHHYWTQKQNRTSTTTLPTVR
jgi:hypothetical protein